MDIKQFALAVHNFAYGTNWDDEDIVSAMNFEIIVEKMKKDEKELKEQKEDAFQGGFDAGREEYQVDQEILDDYQKVLDYMTGHKDGDVYDDHSDWIIEEIKKLKEQVKELKEDLEGERLTQLLTLKVSKDKEEELKKLKEEYAHLRSVHSKVVQDLNARTEKVIEMTLQHE